jgi:hypothetical protein
MPQCKVLQSGVARSCKPLVSGTKDALVVLPLDNILAVVPHPTVKKAVTITRKPSTKAYIFEGKNNSNVLRSDVIKTKYGETYKHEVDLLAFGVDPDAISTVEDLHATRSAAIVENNNGFFEVAGLNAGLQTTKGTRDTANKDTGGAPEITLASEEETGYPEFFMLFDTTDPANPTYDYTATKAAVLALAA